MYISPDKEQCIPELPRRFCDPSCAAAESAAHGGAAQQRLKEMHQTNRHGGPASSGPARLFLLHRLHRLPFRIPEMRKWGNLWNENCWITLNHSSGYERDVKNSCSQMSFWISITVNADLNQPLSMKEKCRTTLPSASPQWVLMLTEVQLTKPSAPPVEDREFVRAYQALSSWKDLLVQMQWARTKSYFLRHSNLALMIFV